MPDLFASLGSFFDRHRAFGLRARNEPGVMPDRENRPPHTASSLADLGADDVRATRLALDSLLRQTSADLRTNSVDQDSLIKAYAEQTDESARRALARQYQCVEAQGRHFEERHDDLALHLRLWDAVALHLDRAHWQQGRLAPACIPGVDIACLQTIIGKAIVRGEQMRVQLQDALDLVDVAADKARLRRDSSLQATMRELDKRVEQQRESSAVAEQVELAGVADGLEDLLATTVALRTEVR